MPTTSLKTKAKVKTVSKAKSKVTSNSDANVAKDDISFLKDSFYLMQTENTRRFDTIDQKFDIFDKKFEFIEERFKKVDQKFEDLTNIMIRGFDAIYQHIDNEIKGVKEYVKDQFTGLDHRISELTKNKVGQAEFSKLDRRVEHIEEIVSRSEL